MKTKHLLPPALLALLLLGTNLHAQIFVTNTNGTIGEYNSDGSTVNASLVSGLSKPYGIAVAGSDIFVTNYANDTIGEYTTSGSTVNASLVSGLSGPWDIAVSGSDIFVINDAGTTIGEYTTSGATVNASLITGLDAPAGIAVSGTDIFVTNNIGSSSIGEYTTSGATVNASLVSGLSTFVTQPLGIAVSGGDIFEANSNGTIGEYTTSGATVNASLISGLLNTPWNIAVSGSDIFVTNGNSIGEYTTSGSTVNASLLSGLNAPLGIAANQGPLAALSVTNPASGARLMVGQSTVSVSGSVSNIGGAGILNGTLSNGAGSLAVSGFSTLSGIGYGTSQAFTGTASTVGAALGANTIEVTVSDPTPTSATGTTNVDVVQNRTVTATSVSFGVMHVGSAASGVTTLSSPGLDSQNTRVTVADSPVADANGISVTGGNPSGTFNGSFSDTRTVSGTLSNLGNINANITLVTGSEGLAGESPINVSVGYTASVFSGKASWASSTGGLWGTNSAWGDTLSAANGAPGLSGTLSIGDTATFNDVAGQTGVSTVDATGLNPTLAAITFNSTHGYTITGGTLNLQGVSTPVFVSTGSDTISSVLSGSGGLNKTGAGTLIVSGANSYTGSFAASGGQLTLQGQLASISYTANIGGTLAFSGATASLSYGSITANAGGAVEYNNATVNGGYLLGSGTQTIIGAGTSNFNGVTTFNSTQIVQNGAANLTNFTNGGSITNAAAGLNWNGGVNNSSGSFTVNSTATVQNWSNNGITTINSGGTLLNTAASDLVSGGGGQILINGGGQLNLQGATALDLRGSLLVNNGTITGQTNIGYGASAQGSGTFGSVSISNGGLFHPGNSPGSAAILGNLGFGAGGSTDFEVDNATGAAGSNSGWDLTTVSGTLGITAGVTTNSQFIFHIDSNVAGNPQLAQNFDPTQSYQWLMEETSQGISGFNPDEFAIDASGFVNPLDGGSFSVSEQDNDLYVNFTPVPEPSTWAMLAMGGAGLLCYRRRVKFLRPHSK